MLYNLLVKPTHCEWYPSQLSWLWLWLISQCRFWQLRSCTLKWQKCSDLHPLYETAYSPELKMLFRLLMHWGLHYLQICAFVLNQCLKALSKLRQSRKSQFFYTVLDEWYFFSTISLFKEMVTKNVNLVIIEIYSILYSQWKMFLKLHYFVP